MVAHKNEEPVFIRAKLVLSLIRAHTDMDDEKFKNVCLEIAQTLDDTERYDLSDYVRSSIGPDVGGLTDGITQMYGSLAERKLKRADLTGRISELEKVCGENTVESCVEDCTAVQHAKHEGAYGHCIDIENYIHGRIAELEEQLKVLPC